MDLSFIIHAGWLTIAGLALDVIGTCVLLFSVVFVSDKEIKNEAKTFYGSNKYVLARLRIGRTQGRCALAFLVVGFVLQIIGQWPE